MICCFHIYNICHVFIFWIYILKQIELVGDGNIVQTILEHDFIIIRCRFFFLCVLTCNWDCLLVGFEARLRTWRRERWSTDKRQTLIRITTYLSHDWSGSSRHGSGIKTKKKKEPRGWRGDVRGGGSHVGLLLFYPHLYTHVCICVCMWGKFERGKGTGRC